MDGRSALDEGGTERHRERSAHPSAHYFFLQPASTPATDQQADEAQRRANVGADGTPADPSSSRALTAISSSHHSPLSGLQIAGPPKQHSARNMARVHDANESAQHFPSHRGGGHASFVPSKGFPGRSPFINFHPKKPEVSHARGTSSILTALRDGAPLMRHG